ncbi:MAG TPA: helix-turn-helix transcriptional regulator [Thermoanaerobaculia bacterium]|nr:helix-turn-helix transcriptional regulator [Thermoanaerobaculia bacterium]
MKRGNKSVLRLIVKFLRGRTDLTQRDFGKAARVDQADISSYELGKLAPPEDSLRRMAEVAGVPWPVVMSLSRFYTAVLSLLDQGGSGAPFSSPAQIEKAVAESVVLTLSSHLVEEAIEEPPSLADQLRAADQVWKALERFPTERRRRLIELSPQPSGNAALARWICETSAQAAADQVEEAKELADLALFTARHVPDEAQRLQAEGFSWGFIANARRVATEFDAADEAFTKAWEHWPKAAPTEPELLPEWRLHTLEASLRREQHRFPEALECLDKALARCGGEPAAAGRILLNREHVFEAMGDTQGALAALEEAAPYVERSGEPHLLFALHFKIVNHFCALQRYAEAAVRLPGVRDLAQGKLHLTRVLWLSARIAAGQGRVEEAMAELEQVRLEFEDLPYEAALASLDLALLYLQVGRTAEVRDLALAIGGIFEAKGIAREALAALTLFCEAAKQETATVALVRQAIAELERAQ